MHASETRSCRQIYTASIYIYIYIYIYVYINCLYVPCMGSSIYSHAMCLLQSGPTIWACVPGWLVVLQCLLGHVAAMVGAVDANRCHMGQWKMKAIHCNLYMSEAYTLIYIYVNLLIFIYVFFCRISCSHRPT